MYYYQWDIPYSRFQTLEFTTVCPDHNPDRARRQVREHLFDPSGRLINTHPESYQHFDLSLDEYMMTDTLEVLLVNTPPLIMTYDSNCHDPPCTQLMVHHQLDGEYITNNPSSYMLG